MTKNGMRAVLTAMLGGAAIMACGGGTPEHAPAVARPVEGEVITVRDTVVTDAFEAAGLAEPVQRAMMSTKLMARVLEVTVREGDRVARGQVLVRLDAADLQARRGQAEAGLAAAEAARQDAMAQARRIRALYADSAAPKATLDAVEAGLARAEAAVRQAEAARSEVDAVDAYATLRAPFAGVVTQRLADPGAFAAPGMPLVVVEDQSSLRLSVTAAPDAVRGIRRGDRLDGTVAGQPVEAVVEGVVPAPGGHVMTVNAMVPNRGDAVFAGSAASLALPLGTRPAILVPGAAIVREGDLTGVRVRVAEGSDLRWIRTGRPRDGQVEVLSGLAAGDQVIVPPAAAEGR
ncbi:MAG TPA: efflux RND transporter periplasmic adaptor subunit [Gemmatimonadales bacterium]|nr:efflux RND transporter periplasmic adaptor subunit [Gemmatimonadales bacterium]